MCWTLCSKKNLNLSRLIISNDDAFKIWCIFNFLSEDHYPLVVITEEVSVSVETLHQRQGWCVVLIVMRRKNFTPAVLQQRPN